CTASYRFGGRAVLPRDQIGQCRRPRGGSAAPSSRTRGSDREGRGVGRDVSAWFASPHIHVQQAISGAISQLHTDLSNAGYSLSGAWVGAEAGGFSDRERSPTAQQQQRSPVDRTSMEDASDVPTVSVSSRVSVYV